MKNWKPFNDECPRCGNMAEVFTSAKDEYVYDGDNVECFECGLLGGIIVDEDDDGSGVARVDWNDYEED
jgi:uncharacterized Zn finger protein